MDIELATQSPNGAKNARLRELLAAHIADCEADELGAAAAYVTIEGVNAVLEAVGVRELQKSRWLVGLDDAISQPGAIDRLLSLPNATVRVVTFAAAGARFHSKIVLLGNTKASKKAVLMIGSANLSRAALEKNAEAVAFIASSEKANADWLRETFEKVWKLGHVPSDTELEGYAEKYYAARKLRKQIEKIVLGKNLPANVIATPDEAQIDPSLATICWIECGRITLMGRELELKGIQARFFGLNPTGGATEVLSLLHNDGSLHETKFIFRHQNGMWRVYFPSSIPEVKAGLRPVEADGSLGRSPYVAVFERTLVKGQFKLKFLRDDEADYAQLKAKSEDSGTVGDTGSRRFGWC
ncbi:hypothetical protein FJV76_23355 [Mesorhizobium sp. WSM4303]|uniref:phospholipase D-like domain-containing protein n=1 Tax=unclassified Mesorhizobium TaxID=325217 RepID=UPI00115D3F83|nr:MULTISPECIES: phospholipase D family protein [unclassified Mesorhizobium]TRC93531.1 hypothetical protein FJV77_22180 [Mesorhizobium sp. WSM4306]TRD01020.1 hypothetical protein FJV76_23355 [Mesorhizobium sp. WSM4303]